MRTLILNLIILISVSGFGQKPTIPASDINFPFVGCNEFTVSWTNGNGNFRIVFVRMGTPFTDVPVQNEYYSENSIFSKGEAINLDSLHFCVYKGKNSSVKVTGLKNNTKYYVAVFEYNGISDYLTSTYPMEDTTTKNMVAQFKIHPASQCLTGNSFQFSNQSYCDLSPLTFSWDFGDGGTSDLKDPAYSYNKAGIMLVKLNAIAPGCYNSTINKDTVYPAPFARFDTNPKYDSIQCWYGNRFTFNNSSTLTDIGAGTSAMRYEWHDGDTLFSSAYKTDYHFISAGVKKVSLVVVSNRNCRDSTSRIFKVLPRVIDPAKVSIAPKSMNLAGNKFTFTNNSPLSASHKWYIIKKYTSGYLDSFAGNTWTYSFKKPGRYYIFFDSYDTAGCYDRLKDSVEVVGVDDVHNYLFQTISIYPNPSISGFFNINNLPANAKAVVYTIHGKEILNLGMEKSISEIDLKRFGSGTYILSIWLEGRSTNNKLMVL